jgi:outer membrane protein insertion porin family
MLASTTLSMTVPQIGCPDGASGPTCFVARLEFGKGIEILASARRFPLDCFADRQQYISRSYTGIRNLVAPLVLLLDFSSWRCGQQACLTPVVDMRWIAVFLVVSSVTIPALAENVSYQGETVSSIRIAGDPRLDTDALRPLVVQGENQPYSDQKIQESMAALKKAGSFTKVSVEVTPEPAGLRVTFILEPAFYVGILRFPGAIKHFTYTRLLQVVNIPDEEVYDKASIPGAQAELISFLHDNGYFQAQVQPETQLDDQHRLANIIFHVQLGPQAKIGEIDVKGASAAEDRRLLHSMQSFLATISRSSLKPGKTYSPARVKAGVGRLRKYLAKHNYLAAKVEVAPADYHPETNRADLTINVQEGPLVLVKTSGARLSFLPFLEGRQKRKLLPVYTEGTVDRDLVSEGRRNLIDYFQRKGYFDVQVTTSFKREPDRILIGYEINKGRKYKVSRISFRGNQHLSEPALSQYLTVQKAHFLSHGKYSPKLMEESVKNIEGAYHDAGFEDVSVTPQVVTHPPNIGLTFGIAEGAQTTVNSVKIEGNKSIAQADLTPKGKLHVRPGGPFSPGAMAQDRSRILATYLDRGYLNAEVNANIERQKDDPHKVDVTFNIEEHQKVTVSQVVVLGDQHTKEELITHVANIGPEIPLSQGRMLEGESALYDLGVFDWSSIGPRRPITTQDEEEALIKVHEAKRNSITYGFGFEVTHRGGNVPSGTVAIPGLPTVGLGNAKIVPSEKTFASPRGSIEYTRSNLRGRAETGTISLLAEQLDQRALLSYSIPHFRGSQWSSLLTGSVERTTVNPLFTARLADGALQFERFVDKKKTTQVQLRYEFNKTDLTDLVFPQLVLPQDRSVHLSTLSGSLIRDTRDKPLDAHRGVYETLDLGITPKAFGSSDNFAKLVGQYAFYKPLGPVVWANSVRLGLASPFAGSVVPTSQRFVAGGGSTLRGFPLNGAGPQRLVTVCGNPSDSSTCSQISVPVGGNQLFILNSEIRAPLPIIHNLGVVFFYDGGNVYRNINFHQFMDDYTNTVGIGLRYDTPVGPVRIDVGHNLNPVPGVSSTQYFITLGQAF